MREEARRRERSGEMRKEDVLAIEWLREGPDSVVLVDSLAWSKIAV